MTGEKPAILTREFAFAAFADRFFWVVARATVGTLNFGEVGFHTEKSIRAFPKKGKQIVPVEGRRGKEYHFPREQQRRKEAYPPRRIRRRSQMPREFFYR